MSKLTDAAIRKYAPNGKRRRIADGSVTGLFLVITPGNHRSFQMRFRVPGGRIGKLTLGRYDASGLELQQEPALEHIGPNTPLTLAAARVLAAKVIREREAGRDVIADRQAAKHRQRLAVQTRDVTGFAGCVRSYIDDHARKTMRGWQWAARQLGLDYGAGAEPTIVKAGLCDRWKDKPVASIDQADITALVSEVKRVGVPGLAVRTKGRSEARARGFFVTLSSLFGWLVHEHVITRNPCRDVARPDNAASRDRVLSEDEIRWFWQATDLVDAPRALDAARPFAPLLKLLLLTGARLDEVAGMTRAELNADRSVWSLPGSRTKNGKPHVVPLPPLARALIESVHGDGDLVFTTTGTSPVSGWSRMKRRLDKLMLEAARKEKADATIEPWRLHDLRRSAVTHMGELGIAPHVIELIVNHLSGTRGGIAGVYNKSTLMPERKAALERWAVHVQSLIERKPAKVITMKPKRAK